MANKNTKANTDQKTLAILAHILTLVGGFLAPLVILLASNDEYVKKHARRSLNWQISSMIYFIVSFILIIILIGILLAIIVGILSFIFVIIATVKASNGELWDYPMAIRFLKD